MSHPQASYLAASPSPQAGENASARTFLSPSGRTWTAFVFPGGGVQAPSAVSGAALRFQSADLVLELTDFPTDWLALPDEALVELARRAQPPKPRTL